MPKLADSGVSLRAYDSNGDPVSGALLHVYLAGTTTPVTVYSDAALTTATTAAANAAGVFTPRFVRPGSYKIDILHPDTLASLPGYPVDNVSFETGSYATVAAFLASSDPARGEGSIWEAGGFRYIELNAAATDQHVSNAGGVKFKALPLGGIYHIEAWGPVTVASIHTAVADIVAEVKPTTTNFQHTPTCTIKCSSDITITSPITINDAASIGGVVEIMGAHIDFGAMRITVGSGWDADAYTPAIHIQARNCRIITPGVDCGGRSSGLRLSQCITSDIDASNIVENAADDPDANGITAVTSGQYYMVTKVTAADWSSIGGPTVAKIGTYFRAESTSADISALGEVRGDVTTYAVKLDGRNDNCTVRSVQFYEEIRGNLPVLRRSVGLFIDSADYTISDIRGGWCAIPIRFGDNAAEITLSKIHPFNGRGLGDLAETAVTAGNHYFIETVTATDWSSIGGGNPATVGSIFVATASSANISALGRVRELPYNPTLILADHNCGDVYIRDSYLDNGVIWDLSGGRVNISDTHYLEYNFPGLSAVVVDQPRMRVMSAVDITQPLTNIEGAGGVSVGFYSSRGNLSPDAGSPTYDFDPSLAALNSVDAWDLQEREVIHHEMNTRRLFTSLRNNKDVSDELPNIHHIFNGRLWERYRSESGTGDIFTDPENDRRRYDFRRLIVGEALNLDTFETAAVESNAIAVTSTLHVLTAAGDTATLNTATGGAVGDLLVVKPAVGKTITVTHNSGAGPDKFYNGGEDIVLSAVTQALVYVHDGFNWLLIGSNGTVPVSEIGDSTAKTDYATVAALQTAVTGGASWADGTVITADGLRYIAETGAAITGIPAGLRPLEPIYAKHFGAVEDFDGSTGTNDRVAIQRAIDYQFSQGGGDVWIEGQSVVSGTVQLLAGVNIRRVREGSADLEQVGKTAYPITFDMGSAIIGSHSGGPVVRMHDLRSKLDITIGATEARRDAALLSTSATSWNGGVLVMKSADADVDPDETAIVSNILEGLVVRDQPCDSIMIAQNVTSLRGIHCISISPGRCHLVIDNGAHIGTTGEGRPGVLEIAHFKGANSGAEALRIGHPDNGPTDIPYRVSINVFECFRSGVWKSQRFNPSTAVNTTTDTITVTGHPWSNGDKLLYSRGEDTSSPPTGNSVAGDDIGGLVSGACYFVVNATTNTIQLSATSGGAAINLTDTGAGNYDHILSDVSRMTPILDGADELYAAAYVRGEQVSISNAAISGTSTYSGDAAHLHANWAINGQQIAIRESRMIAYRDSPILIFEAGGQENAGITLTNIHCANGNATDPANLVRFCGTVTVDDLRIEGITGNLTGFPIDIGAFRASHAGSCVVLHDGMRFETGYMQQVQDGYFTLADDAATSIPLLPAGFSFSFGLIAIGANTASSEPSIVAYRVGTSPFVQVISGSMTAGSGVLSGTTGTDGDITVSAHTDGRLYLENRRGGASNFTWRVLVANA